MAHDTRAGLMRALGAAVVLAVVAAGPAMGQGALPDPARTPGALNSAVTQETIGATICVRGWTRTVRPPREYTSALKRQQLREFGYTDRKMGDYEEDHLIPLAFGRQPDRSAQPLARTSGVSRRMECGSQGSARGYAAPACLLGSAAAGGSAARHRGELD
jgi:hypothetical protein